MPSSGGLPGLCLVERVDFSVLLLLVCCLLLPTVPEFMVSLLLSGELHRGTSLHLCRLSVLVLPLPREWYLVMLRGSWLLHAFLLGMMNCGGQSLQRQVLRYAQDSCLTFGML